MLKYLPVVNALLQIVILVSIFVWMVMVGRVLKGIIKRLHALENGKKQGETSQEWTKN